MAQAPSVAVPQRLPLVVEPENRDETTGKDAKLVNGYVELNDKTKQYWVYKRPGLLQYGATRSGAGLGVYNWQGNIYSIFNGRLYKDSLDIGTVDAAHGVYQWASSLGDTPRLQLGNGYAAYNWDNTTLVQILTTAVITAGDFIVGAVYTIVTVGTTDFMLIGAPANTVGVLFTATGAGAGTGTARTDSNFPADWVKGWAYLDGTTYVMGRDAYIHGSDTEVGMNRPDLWTDLLNTIGAQIEPDKGVCLAKQLVYVLALKEWSTEVFYDAQNPPGASPLSPVQGAKINYGCVSADSVQEIDGTLLWLATNRSSAAQVILVENLKPVVVSTKAIERLLGEADFTAIASFGVKYEGHRFYGLTLKNNNLTLVYDLADKMWAQWTGPTGNYFPMVANTYLPGTGRVFQHETNGKLYKLDSDYTSDDGELITVDIYAPNFDGGVRRRKQVTMMEFVGDRTSGSVLQVRFNDADFAEGKWTNFRLVDMDVTKAILTNCGTFLRRATHIRHACDSRMRIQAIELQLDIGIL
ncbi:MAG: hypothetical protein JZU60_02680 [Ilumatobacteraceae bacterium]|nr:hypothetical protein [Ilumatobacteraceae bacterium]